MKTILKSCALLATFTLFFSFMPLICHSVEAQETSAVTVKKTELSKAQRNARRREIREVRKFVDDFFLAFNQTKDLNQVPEKLFSDDFKSRFAKNDELSKSLADSESNIQFTDNELYEYNVLTANFIGLITSSYIGNFSGDLDDYDTEDFFKLLPPQVVKAMNKSKWYQGYFNQEVEAVSPKNKEEMKSLVADMKTASDELRAYLKNRPLKWRRKYSRNFSKWRKEANPSGISEVCYDGGNCEDFPKKTRIFAMHAFSLCLRITKINGELKIVNIYISFNED